jgi:SAM-dependent methyltransferase
MGVEQPAAFYDEVYTQPSRYESGLEAPWRRIWDWTSRRIPKGARVLELGCGLGQLAALTPKASAWLGVDFSQVAILKAKEAAPDRRFECLPVTHESTKALIRRFAPTVVVACEFLEHVEGDLEILSALGSVPFIGTVPCKDSAGHVRFFPTVTAARARYGRFGLRVLGLKPMHWGLVSRRVAVQERLLR